MDILHKRFGKTLNPKFESVPLGKDFSFLNVLLVALEIPIEEYVQALLEFGIPIDAERKGESTERVYALYFALAFAKCTEYATIESLLWNVTCFDQKPGILLQSILFWAFVKPLAHTIKHIARYLDEHPFTGTILYYPRSLDPFRIPGTMYKKDYFELITFLYTRGILVELVAKEHMYWDGKPINLVDTLKTHYIELARSNPALIRKE